MMMGIGEKLLREYGSDESFARQNIGILPN